MGNSQMLLVLIAWLYVTLLMGLAEATAPNGTILGGAITFLVYGLLPIALVGYIFTAPARARAARARAKAEQAAWVARDAASAAQPDAGGHTSTAAEQSSVAPVGKEP